MNIKYFLFTLLITFTFLSCEKDSNTTAIVKTKFEYLNSEETGISFANILDEDKLKNPFNYINAYNGGGVGIGDINNDGLQDIVFTGNMVSSKIYLNKGNLKFEDITATSGLNFNGWATAVSMVDINLDGWLDIYICRSYHDDPNLRKNLCLINNKNNTFTEVASNIGIADENYSIGAAFLDYDKDGDLDLFVANHPRHRSGPLSMHLNYRKNPEAKYSSKLFRNDGHTFTDVTVSAGILSYGFCLAISTSDYDLDGWPDIFVTVDHDEEEMIFRNKGDGTFSYETQNALKQNSNSSMGVDVGDINGDKYPDYYVVEMLPKDYYREKVSMNMQSVQKFTFLTDTVNYNYFQMRNFLHLNNGNGTFSDIGQLAGVHKSDWSWSCLFIDGNNDGQQDLFVANGYWRDVYNKDLQKKLDVGMKALKGDLKKMNQLASDYSKNCPTDKIRNVFFEKNGRLQFQEITEQAGFTKATVSCGAAYGDLDNDGDLDIVINNTGEASNIIENKVNDSNSFLRIQLLNAQGAISLGAKAYFTCDDSFQSRELLTTRGYQSSSEPFIHFGSNKICSENELKIIWPSGKTQILKNVTLNKTLTLKETQNLKIDIPIASKTLVRNISPEKSGIDFIHKENDFDDYNHQVLLPHKMSEQGPFISKADINGDGFEDFFIGAPTGQAAAIFIQNKNGRFKKIKTSDLEKDKLFEDAGSAFSDIDNDGDLDLIVTSGGYEFDSNSNKHLTRIYLNDGQLNFVRAPKSYLVHDHASSCVRPYDYDNDGDIDLFIGGLLQPKKYPLAGTSALYINDGNGQYKKLENANFENVGMVKDATWIHLNTDKKADLIIVGEWMPISFWTQENNNFIDKTSAYLNDNIVGWWNCIKKIDLDNNGLDDLVIGNLGLNYKYKASKEKPFKIYSNDVDSSGTYDILLSTFYEDTEYPVRGKSCSTQQIPGLESKFKSYDAFSKSDMSSVYGDNLIKSKNLNVTEFRSLILYQDSLHNFSIDYLPVECQKSPINSIVAYDINNDSKKDLIMAGNLYQSEIETGRADFGTGVILINEGQKKWKPLKVYESGLYIPGDVKSINILNSTSDAKSKLIIGNNKDRCEVFEFID